MYIITQASKENRYTYILSEVIHREKDIPQKTITLTKKYLCLVTLFPGQA